TSGPARGPATSEATSVLVAATTRIRDTYVHHETTKPETAKKNQDSFSCFRVSCFRAKALPRRECEQHVSGHPSPQRVAGVGDDEAVGNDRPGGIERTALRRHLVHRLVLLCGVEVPDDAAVFRGVGAQVSAHGAGEPRPGNEGARCGLCADAAATAGAFELRRRRVPHLLAGCDLEREETAGIGGRT